MVRRRIARIGLLDAEVSWPQIAAKRRREAERIEQQLRQAFELVGADGEAAAAVGELVERWSSPGKARERSAMWSA